MDFADDAEGGAEQGQRVGAVVGPSLAQGPDVDHGQGGDHDVGRQHRERKAGQPVGPGQDDGQQDQGRDDARQRTLRAGGDVDRRARDAAADGHAAGEGGDQVGAAQTDQFAVGVDAFAALDGQGLRHRDVLHHADQGEQGRGDEQFLEGSGRRELQRKRGGTLFHVADDGYAVLEVEVEAHDGEGGDGDDDERDEAADESGGGVRKAGADQQPGQAAPGEEEDEERQRGDQ